VKMALITHAYFDEGDFSKVQLLHDTYHHLNSCLAEIDISQSAIPQLYVGERLLIPAHILSHSVVCESL
jgi:hypothetical protein